MTAAELPLPLAAAFLAGALNAVAGGGSFLTLPALVWAGLPAVAANATGTVALLPGYLSAAWGYRQDVQAPPRLTLRQVLTLSAAGGGLGAAALLAVGERRFDQLIPWLLLLATAAFAASPWLTSRRSHAPGQSAWPAAAAVFAVAVYGGFFNGGLGILLLAAFGLLGSAHLNAMNGLKNIVSALLSAVAVAVYAAGGVVDWRWAAALAVAATAGGYAGARVGRRIPAPWLRAGIVGVGLVMTALFFMRNA